MSAFGLDHAAEPDLPRQISLSCDSTPCSVREVLDRLDVRFADLHVTEDWAGRARIVLAEVCNNVVEHAYRAEPNGEIRLTVALGEAALICEVRDGGAPMPAGPLPGERYPDIDPDHMPGWPEGGFGWAIVRDLTDDLQYARLDGENVLRFRIPRETGPV